MLVFSRVAVGSGVGDARVFSCLSGPLRGWVMLAFSRVSVATRGE
jgi:hypothetical protein